jgi:uncharacterized Zn-finger protein
MLEEPLDLSLPKAHDQLAKQVEVNLLEYQRKFAKYFANLRCAKAAKCKSLLFCGVCNKVFDRPSLLNRHIRSHTGADTIIRQNNRLYRV